MKTPSAKDTIGCATEVKQPEVPDISKSLEYHNAKAWYKQAEYERWYGRYEKRK